MSIVASTRGIAVVLMSESASSATSADGRVYVDAAHLAKLEFHARGLSFIAPAPVSSVLSGSHASRLRGRGLNFEEIRGYLPATISVTSTGRSRCVWASRRFAPIPRSVTGRCWWSSISA